VVLFCPPVNGARRWIPIGISFQPSEIAKFAIILLFAQLIAINHKKMGTFKYGVLTFVFLLAPILLLMYFEPHLSGMVLITLIACLMMFIGGTKIKWFAIGGAVAVAGLLVIIFSGGIEYALGRVQGWLDPFSDPKDSTYQTIQSLIAIGSGGLFGKGLGNSRQKYLFLPEPQNDFIFAIVCEELGFIGALIIIVLFGLLVWRGFVIAIKAPDKFGSMLAAGIVIQVGLQTLLNIAVVTNTMPNTGISLPFFSYGGTSLMMLLAQMGVVLSVSRQSTLKKQ
jgi:cell division protein FtsW